MAADSSLYEKDINVLVKEYLSFIGLDKTLYSLQLECKEKGKSIPTGNEIERDGSKLTAQNNILLEFDNANFHSFWTFWEDNVPSDIRSRDQTCQRLEFYIHIHFAVYPIRVGAVTANRDNLEKAMAQFKKFLETKGSDLSQTTEFLPFYALPFVPNPLQHPSFKELFSTYWVPDLRARVDRFLSAALSATEPPLLITLFKNKGRLSVAEDVSELATKTLQQHLIQAEKRCSAYMKRFNNLQADYHTLISITAELVDSLEQTVHGKMITVEYLQRVCARLFSGRSVAASINAASFDFTRPGTASSILRASIAPNHFYQEAEESTLLPSLDYNKIKLHLRNGSDRTKAFLLQALRWRLTRSNPGEQRDTVLQSFIEYDLFQCRQKSTAAKYDSSPMLQLFESSDAAVRQYAARLYNALASLQQGRAYLCSDPEGVGKLQKYLWRGRELDKSENAIDHVFEEHLLGCLQKLSLRRPLQSVMIRGNLIRWLTTILSEHETLSDYMLEYAVALLMNLCLRSNGKRKCGEDAAMVLKVLSDLLTHENAEIRPYVNGALYSVLSNQRVREEALSMGLEAVLRDSMEGEQEEFKRQLEFIIKQLNKKEDDHEDEAADSDDEGDEDDDEDQDAMEADLDKDEVIQPRPNELCGEQLLCSDYLGIMTNSQPKVPKIPVVDSLTIDAGIPTRPTTPGHQRGSSSHREYQVTSNTMLQDRPHHQMADLHSSSNLSTHTALSQSMNDSHPPIRSGSSASNPRIGTPEAASQSRLNSARSVRSRQLPLDHETSVLMTQMSGVEQRHLSLPTQNNLTLPQGKEGSGEVKEYMQAFSSRPRITRTPDKSGRAPLSSRVAPNPTYSLGEPSSRPVSAQSWRGSKGSSGSVGDSKTKKHTSKN